MTTVSSWIGATGNWRKAADWSNGIPDASTQAEFTQSGSYTVTLSRSDAFDVAGVALDAAGATLALQGSLSVGGVFDLKLGTLAMSKAGVIHGGTLSMDGGTIFSQGGVGSKGGTLDGVHLAGTLDLAAGVEQLNITNGLIGASGVGDEIKLSGGEDVLRFAGSQTLSDATIVIASSYDVVYASGALTLGPGAVLTTTALGPQGVLTGGKVINNGSIIAAASGQLGQFNIGLDTFINNAVVTADANIYVTAGNILNAASGEISVGPSTDVFFTGRFMNRGAISVADRGFLDIASDTNIVNSGTIAAESGNLSIDQSTGSGVVTFTNTGAITVGASGSLSLLINFTVASLGNVEDAGLFYLGGTLDNSGQTLRLDSGPLFGGSGAILGVGGLVTGGTAIRGHARLAYTGGGLANVTFEGVLDLSAANAAVNLDGGVAITGANGAGPGVVNLTGKGAALTFFDLTGTTANGIDNVTINAGNAHGAVTIALFNFDGAAETLTFGVHSNIVSSTTGAQVIVQNQASTASTVVNAGQIDAEASGGGFSVTVTTLENDGRIVVANGDAFTLIGALTGSGAVTIATGGVADLGAAAASQGVVFADTAGTLKLSSTAQFAATISGAVAGDKIDLIGTAATSASVNARDQLVITNNGTKVATFQLAGDYSHTTFNVAGDGAGGSVITLANTADAHRFAQASSSVGGVCAVVTAASGAHLEMTHSPTLALCR